MYCALCWLVGHAIDDHSSNCTTFDHEFADDLVDDFAGGTASAAAAAPI